LARIAAHVAGALNPTDVTSPVLAIATGLEFMLGQPL
jgi:hypothetical protein